MYNDFKDFDNWENEIEHLSGFADQLINELEKDIDICPWELKLDVQYADCLDKLESKSRTFIWLLALLILKYIKPETTQLSRFVKDDLIAVIKNFAEQLSSLKNLSFTSEPSQIRIYPLILTIYMAVIMGTKQGDLEFCRAISEISLTSDSRSSVFVAVLNSLEYTEKATMHKHIIKSLSRRLSIKEDDFNQGLIQLEKLKKAHNSSA